MGEIDTRLLKIDDISRAIGGGGTAGDELKMHETEGLVRVLDKAVLDGVAGHHREKIKAESQTQDRQHDGTEEQEGAREADEEAESEETGQ